MPTVTALRRVGRRRLLVEVDGEPWRAFSEGVVVATRLVPGQELDRARLVELARERRRAEALERERLDAEQIETALVALEPERERAYRVLSRRGANPATAQRLARRGFAEDAIESALRAFAETEARAYD